MLEGEGGKLIAERVALLERGRSSKAYKFQVRNDDGREHFRRISRQHTELCFVLVYGDSNAAEYGSYLIRNGRIRSYRLPSKLQEDVMGRHSATDDDDEDWRFWEASWELMDLAEARWQQAALKAIGASAALGRTP